MVYFIRRYIKGQKNSGCSDVLTSEDPITNSEFVKHCYGIGEGKYILGQRGKGIRGFKKITDCVVEALEVNNWTKSFAAEEISVKQNIKLNKLSDADLLDLMQSMSDTDVNSADDFSKFKQDLKNIHSEISRRGLGNMNPTLEKNAESPYGLTDSSQPKLNLDQPLASAGFAAGKSSMAVGFVGGLLVGIVGSMYYYKTKMDSINAELERINSQLNEAETAIKRAESREEKRDAARSAVKSYDSRLNMDAEFLANFNRNMGPNY